MKGRKSKMNKLQEEIENRHLPELMRLDNGDAVTNYEDWKLRREEIKKLLCHEYMGVTPENIKSAFECVGVDEDAYGGKATEKTIKVQLANNNDAYEFIFKLILPKAVKEKIPAFLHLQFNELVAGGLGEEIIDNGYAIVHVCYQDIDPDDSKESFLGVSRFEKDWIKKDRWGKIAVWAYGVLRWMSVFLLLWLEIQEVFTVAVRQKVFVICHVNIHVTGFARICFVMIVMQMICHLTCIF